MDRRFLILPAVRRLLALPSVVGWADQLDGQAGQGSVIRRVFRRGIWNIGILANRNFRTGDRGQLASDFFEVKVEADVYVFRS